MKIATTYLALTSSLAFGQGPLAPPPGPPVATMKTLSQIEARTPIPATVTPAAGPHFTISQSGSYYLTGNITVTTGDAIRITTDAVSLDLNGYTIKSTLEGSSVGSAIKVSGAQVSIENGIIRSGSYPPSFGAFLNWGFAGGIQVGNGSLVVKNVQLVGIGGVAIGTPSFSTTPFYVHVSNCHILYCERGINAKHVESCTVDSAASDGIVAANVSNCQSATWNGNGINASNVVQSQGSSVTGNGIIFTYNATNCYGSSSSGVGINVTDSNNNANGSANATNCTGSSTSNHGMRGMQNAMNCTGQSSSTSPGIVGIGVWGTASYCRGKRDGGIAISAQTAVACTPQGTGTVAATTKHLGTP